MLNDKNVTTYDVVEGVKNGESEMIEILNRWQNDIATGIKGLADIFDPDCVVLSGSMAQFVDIKKLKKKLTLILLLLQPQ